MWKLEDIRIALQTSTTDADGCTADHVIKAEIGLSQTKESLSPISLKTGQTLEITVKQKKDSNAKVWKYIYSTPKRGSWLTSYGFTFIPHGFVKEELYYSKPGTNSEYIITPQNKRSQLSYAPSIFFTWMPQKDLQKNVSFNFTAGLGFDLEAPTAFLGGSVFYNQFISLAFGFGAHKQQFLDGKYEPCQSVKESLDEDQLHESLYTVNPFLSLTFRFANNPFQ